MFYLEDELVSFWLKGRSLFLSILNLHIMQFQKREYANVELFRCGKKGHGLRALENIRRGSFIIEYVGEVSTFVMFIYFRTFELPLGLL